MEVPVTTAEECGRMKVAAIACLFVVLVAARKPGKGDGSSGSNTATTEDAYDDESYGYEDDSLDYEDDSYDTDDDSYESDDDDDSEMEATVKALIDAGTCEAISKNGNCGDDATGYYSTFEYNGYRIVVSSGAPDHDAEYDQTNPNPNDRCKLYRGRFACAP